jgi:hypothetical protein
MSGAIREESTLKLTFGSTDFSNVHEFIIQTHNPDGSLIESATFSPLVLPSTTEDNSITNIEIDFSTVGIDVLWSNINYIYKGMITDYLVINYIPT